MVSRFSLDNLPLDLWSIVLSFLPFKEADQRKDINTTVQTIVNSWKGSPLYWRARIETGLFKHVSEPWHHDDFLNPELPCGGSSNGSSMVSCLSILLNVVRSAFNVFDLEIHRAVRSSKLFENTEGSVIDVYNGFYRMGGGALPSVDWCSNVIRMAEIPQCYYYER